MASGFRDTRTDQQRQQAPAVPASRTILASAKLSSSLTGALLGVARAVASAVVGTSPLGMNLVEQVLPVPEPRQPNKPQISPLAFGDLTAAGNLMQSQIATRSGAGAIRSAIPKNWQALSHSQDLQTAVNVSQRIGKLFSDPPTKGGWTEPMSFAPLYPYNRVVETEAGHLFELDDTPGAQRIHLAHRSGTFFEMHPDGSMVIKSTKHGYLITLADQFVQVAGNCQVTIVGDATVQVQGNLEAVVGGNATLNVTGDTDMYAKNISLHAQREVFLDAPVIKLGGYTTLPTSLTPLMGVLVPRCKFGSSSSAAPTDDLPTVDIVSTPLSDPTLYDDTSPTATAARAIQFDNPDELGATDAYSAHIAALSSLGEVSGTDRQLPGVSVQTDAAAPGPEPPIR